MKYASYHPRTKEVVDIRYLDCYWKYNVLLIGSYFHELLDVIDPRVKDEIYMSDRPQSMRDVMLHESLKKAKDKGDKSEGERLCRVFIAKRLNGISYSGSYT